MKFQRGQRVRIDVNGPDTPGIVVGYEGETTVVVRLLDEYVHESFVIIDSDFGPDYRESL